MKLRDRVVLVTGGSRGFGQAVVKACLEEGASVVLCGRDAEAVADAESALKASVLEGARLLGVVADVTNPDRVAELVAQIVATFGRLDVLVCNAGVYGPKGPIEEVDWSEWSEAISINLMGLVLCCKAVVPQMKAQQAGKIILLSGGGATKPMPFLSAYAASKAAVVRFGETLAEELRNWNIEVNSVAPGALNTRLLDEVLAQKPETVGVDFYKAAQKQKAAGGTPLERGASLCVYLASSESDGLTGKLISAVWDPWEAFDQRKDVLKSTDIYTLRRIIPQERQQDWG